MVVAIDTNMAGMVVIVVMVLVAAVSVELPVMTGPVVCMTMAVLTKDDTVTAAPVCHPRDQWSLSTYIGRYSCPLNLTLHMGSNTTCYIGKLRAEEPLYRGLVQGSFMDRDELGFETMYADVLRAGDHRTSK